MTDCFRCAQCNITLAILSVTTELLVPAVLCTAVRRLGRRQSAAVLEASRALQALLLRLCEPFVPTLAGASCILAVCGQTYERTKREPNSGCFEFRSKSRERVHVKSEVREDCCSPFLYARANMARTMQSKRKPVYHRETPSTSTSTLQTAPKPDPAAVPSTSTSSGSGLASTTRPPKAKVPREPLPKEAFIRETRSKRALREQNVEEQPPPKQQKQAVKAKAARAPVAAAVKEEEQAQASIRRIGQKFSPGDGQLDYVISAFTVQIVSLPVEGAG